MFYVIPSVLILISLSIIISIIVRKFSVLANLDVDNMKSEREARFKERMVSNRIKRSYRKYFLQFSRIFKPLFEASGKYFMGLYKKLINLKEEKEREREVEANMDEPQNIEQLFHDADELIREEDFSAAEKKYIEIISIDSRNFLAFKKLGKVYFDRRDYIEAKQTLEHALKLTENISAFPDNSTNEKYSEASTQISGMYFDLALICIEIGVQTEALVNIDKALSLEPNNPRYLDTKLGLCIAVKDKNKASVVFEKLKESNPDNQKLDELKEMINNLEKEV